MKKILTSAGSLAIAATLALGLLVQFPLAVRAGDSLYGKVTAIKGANLVTFDHGAGVYDIRLAGIQVPDNRGVQQEAVRFMTEMLLDKPARLRFDGRTAAGEMVGRLFTDDRRIGIKDAGVELVRAGMAVPQRGYTGYKYGELAQAQREARARKLGVWSSNR